MVSEVITGLGIFNSIFSSAKGLKEINDAVVRNAAIADLLDKLVTAKSEYAAIQERVSDLEKEVKRFEAWEAEKQRYILTDYGGGTFAYALKPKESRGEPSHRLCANCYEQGGKSILQHKGSAPGQELFGCPRCKTEFWFGVYRHEPIEYPDDS